MPIDLKTFKGFRSELHLKSVELGVSGVLHERRIIDQLEDLQVIVVIIKAREIQLAWDSIHVPSR